MPNLKEGSKFIAPHIPLSSKVICPNCSQEITRGTTNYTFSPSKFSPSGWFEHNGASQLNAHRYTHKSCTQAPQPEPTSNWQKVKEATNCTALEALNALAASGQDVERAIQAIIDSRKPQEPKQIATPPATPSTPIIVTKPKGYHRQYPALLKLIESCTDTYLGGSPGAGKSHAIRTASEYLNREYAYLALSDATMPSEIFGYRNHAGDAVRTLFYKLYKFGGTLDIAELDNTNAGVFTLLNNALDNGHYYFIGNTKDDPMEKVVRHPTFCAIGNGNTFLRGGDAMFPARQRQDAAAIERFVFVNWKYDLELEKHLAMGTELDHTCEMDFTRLVIPASRREKIITWAQSLRTTIEAGNKLGGAGGHQLVVSMRGMLKLVKLLTLGFTSKEAAHMAIFKEYAQTETLLNLHPIDF